MMKGVIDFVTGPSLDAKLLRDNFVFKIIPMLNPDGRLLLPSPSTIPPSHTHAHGSRCPGFMAH